MLLLRPELRGTAFDGAEHGTPEAPPDWAIDETLASALTTTGAEAAEIFLRDGESGVSLAGFRGPCAEAFGQITHFEEGQGYPGLVASHGRPINADLGRDARFLRTDVRDAGFRHILCVPIPGNERPLGSLDVAWRSGFDDALFHCVMLSRDAERLGSILEADEQQRGAGEGTRLVAAADDPAARLDLSVPGAFEARRGGLPLRIDSFARRRAVTLLKILLTHYGKVVLRDELIELLWPSDAPKDATKLLKIAVHYLRRGLGESPHAKPETQFILTEPNGYAFNPASFHRIDVLEFEALADEGLRYDRQGRWRDAFVKLHAASELYRGDYLEDELYSDWCVRRRRHLRELLFDVLITTGRLVRSAGDDEAAIRCYQRILELDPCLEEVHRDLMEVLSRSGKRIQALRQFEACRKALRDEFDASPALETETLYRSILTPLPA